MKIINTKSIYEKETQMGEISHGDHETRKKPTVTRIAAGLAAAAGTAVALTACAEATAGPRAEWTPLETSVASPVFVGNTLSTPAGVDAIGQAILDYEQKVRDGALDATSADSIATRGKVADLAGLLTASIDAPLFGQDGPAKNALQVDFANTEQTTGKKAGETYRRTVMAFADSPSDTRTWVEVSAQRGEQKMTSPNYEQGDTWYSRKTTVETKDGDRIISGVAVTTEEGVLTTEKRADVHVTIDGKQYGLAVVGQRGYRHLTGMSPVYDAPNAGVKFYEGASAEGTAPITDESLSMAILAKAAKTVVAANQALSSPNAEFTGVGTSAS